MKDVDDPIELLETESWIRNPKLCIRECRDMHQELVAWNAGYLYRAGFDVRTFMNLHYGGQPWRVLIVDYDTATEFTYDEDEEPQTWSTWTFARDQVAALVDLMEQADEEGGRVIVREPPELRSRAGWSYTVELANLQAEYPNARMHMHDMSSLRAAFGLGFHSADIEVRVRARKGELLLPNGSHMSYEEAWEKQKAWVRLLGFDGKDIESPRQRCMYNILACRWAGQNFRKNVMFKTRGFGRIDPRRPVPPRMRSGKHTFKDIPRESGDYLICDVCSQAEGCRFFRVGSVCSVPGSEGDSLIKAFQSRDSEQILAGLGELMKIGVERLEEARTIEKGGDDGPEIHPHVTKMINDLFSQGERLAMLVNPALKHPQASLPPAPPPVSEKELTRSVLAALEARGISRDAITPELIQDIGALLGEGLQIEPAIDKVLLSLPAGP